jgi:hypothetical protein
MRRNCKPNWWQVRKGETMTHSRGIAKIESQTKGKPATPPRLMALALAICVSEDGDL